MCIWLLVAINAQEYNYNWAGNYTFVEIISQYPSNIVCCIPNSPLIIQQNLITGNASIQLFFPASGLCPAIGLSQATITQFFFAAQSPNYQVNIPDTNASIQLYLNSDSEENFGFSFLELTITDTYNYSSCQYIFATLATPLYNWAGNWTYQSIQPSPGPSGNPVTICDDSCVPNIIGMTQNNTNGNVSVTYYFTSKSQNYLSFCQAFQEGAPYTGSFIGSIVNKTENDTLYMQLFNNNNTLTLYAEGCEVTYTLTGSRIELTISFIVMIVISLLLG